MIVSHHPPTSYLCPALEGRYVLEKGGHGVFALQAVRAGQLLAVMGGEVIDAFALSRLSPAQLRRTIQVEEALYLWSAWDGPADWINHSCEPNAGLCGQIAVVAMRDIAAGEEICFDYAMCDGTPYDEFPCACGAALCRGRITGEDWRLPGLWTRYEGYFSPYLQRRIEALRGEMNGAHASGRAVAHAE